MSAAWASSRIWLRRSRRPDSSRSRTVSVSRIASPMTTGLGGGRRGVLRRARRRRGDGLGRDELAHLSLQLADPVPHLEHLHQAAQRREDDPDQEPDLDRVAVLQREDGGRAPEQRHEQVDDDHDGEPSGGLPAPSARRKRSMMRSWQTPPPPGSLAPRPSFCTGKIALAIVRWPPPTPRSPKAARVTSPALFT